MRTGLSKEGANLQWREKKGMKAQSEKTVRYDARNFTIREMTECGAALRKMGEDGRSMEDVARRMVRYLYDGLIDGQSGERACSLIRFYKTHSFGALDDGLQDFARARLKGHPVSPDTKCLVLLATAGEVPDWNSRKTSRNHQAIPLPSEEAIGQAPMISNLITQLGLSVGMVVKPDQRLLLDLEQKTYNVFHVPEAFGSPHIPAQQEFVIPQGIRSVLGFGGMLPSGDMFAVILFFKVPVLRETADFFKVLSLNVKVAILPFEQAVFEGAGEAL